MVLYSPVNKAEIAIEFCGNNNAPMSGCADSGQFLTRFITDEG